MPRTFLTAAALLCMAAPAVAQILPGSSLCAALSEFGPVAAPGPPDIMPAKPTADRRLVCPDDFRLDATGRMPLCLRPGIKVIEGNPRRACYAAMPFGPIADIAPRLRPTRSCATRLLTTIVRMEGANVGAADADFGVIPPDGITVIPLNASGPEIATAENPVLQGCFAFSCRLVKLEIGARAAPRVALQLRLPGRDTISQVVKLADNCPH